jgi:L-xylulokinase
MILSIDTGLTLCKAVLFGDEGEILASNSAPTPVISGDNGRSEMDARGLWLRVAETVRKTLSGFDAEKIKAAGVSGHGNGLYLLNKSGEPEGNAVTSMDTLSADCLPDKDTAAFISSRALQNSWPGQPGIILRRVKRDTPERLRRAGHVLFCKDYLSFMLTGKALTDFSDASASGLMNNLSGKWDNDILGALGLPELTDILPPVIRGFDIRGPVTKEASAKTGIPAGVPVIGGMFDVDACIYGSGVAGPRGLASIAGTWNINAAMSGRPLFSPELRQCVRRADGKSFMLIDSSATSAVNFEWLLKKFFGGVRDYRWLEKVLTCHRWTGSSPYWLPFVGGNLGTGAENAAWAGADINSGAEDLAAAVAEGVCFAHRLHLENLFSAGAAKGPVRLSGGAARPAFCQLFADVTGLPAETPQAKQSGAEGIRLAALTALGRRSDMNDAVRTVSEPENTFQFD